MLHDRLMRNAGRRFFAALPFVLTFSPAALAQDAPPPPLIIISQAGAFADGIASQVITDNVVVDTNSVQSTLLQSSIWNNVGITQLNQDSGIGVNQANIVLIAISAGAENPVSLATFYGEQREANNSITLSNVSRSNVISDVLNGSSGIVQINQNSGNLNSNLNVMVIALGLGTGSAAVSLTDVGLAGASSNIQYKADGSIQQSNVVSGLSNFSGMAQITQTAGDGNKVSNTMVLGIQVINIQ